MTSKVHWRTKNEDGRHEAQIIHSMDHFMRKNLGVFYTPEPYAKISHELLRKAIERVPKGNDYIIVDRCAGTGNLEIGLTVEELSHCILSTMQEWEYQVLMERLGSKVRYIIHDSINGTDALSEKYVTNSILQQYIQNPTCTIILFENLPYSQSSSIEHQKMGVGKNSTWKKSFVCKEMKNWVTKKRKHREEGEIPVWRVALNDLVSLFIWSAFQYYLRMDTDSYVVFAPIKYWKAQHLIQKKFMDGFACNRYHFHTNTNACITCILWSNEEDNKLNKFSMKGYDIEKKSNQLILYSKEIIAKKIYNRYSQVYYDKRNLPEDAKNGILVGYDGFEKKNGRVHHGIFHKNIIGYLVVSSSGFENPDLMSSLLIASRYDGNGFYLYRDNYLEKLPLFAASRYIRYNSNNWTLRGMVMKSADGEKKYEEDIKNGKIRTKLLKCLLFTVLEMQNHMITFTGSDGHFYRNELSLDGTNGETIAIHDLNNLEMNTRERELVSLWDTILGCAKRTKNYRKEITYGVYQISKELDTFHYDTTLKKRVYDYDALHLAMQTLRSRLKEYYNEEIVPFLYAYEFLK